MAEHPFRLLKSEVLFRGRAFAIRRDVLLTPDGRETRFEIVEHHGSVILLPLDEAGNLLFVRQYRHAAGEMLLELPAGSLDEGESPEACAARELREETGYAARKLEKVGEFFLAPGYSTEKMSVFIARELYAAPLQADADEFLDLVRLPLEEALRAAENGEIPDAKSLAALYLARGRLMA
ncbi:MAG: NUDIX hydrolase [Chloroflexi bacterium]|jgi:ADP-ribose pyrophosphatase|nr:NUDIX hydrolase [Chloroflexota bacterium]